MSKGNDLTLAELREIAKSHGITGISTLRKPELMALLYSVSQKEKEEREAAERAAAEGGEPAAAVSGETPAGEAAASETSEAENEAPAADSAE